MAIYHLHAKPITRSQGQSAVASAAYRRATEFKSEKEDKTFDYTNKRGVVHSEILIPEDSPAWLQEIASVSLDNVHKGSEILWNHIELLEKRSDAQFAREIEFSLPIELNQEQNIILAREFIKDQFVLRGMVADWSIHWDEGNPHVHVMLTLREITPDGFGLKNREWNKKEMLHTWREKWSEYANFHLKLHEHNVSIDHRSFKDQGIDLIPTVHEGKAIKDMERRGISTNVMKEANHARRENLRRIAAKPELALEVMASQSSTFTYEQLGQTLGKYINDKGNFSIKEMSQDDVVVKNTLANFDKISGDEKHQKVLTPEAIADIFKKIEQHDAVFSQDDLIKALTPYTDNAEIFAKVVIEIKASPELIYLGTGVDGRDRFTTQKMFRLENEIQRNADILSHQKHIKISSKKIQATLKSYKAKTGNDLTEEQLNAVKHVLTPSSLSCIVGRAGTGKSFSLGAANSVWESQGLRVMGVSLSGIATEGLSQESGIQSRTLASFKSGIENKTITLDKNDVIVMDEAGMTDSELMHFVLKETKAANAKLVLVGDPDQLQPIGPGAVFRALLERVGFAEIKTIYRQKEAWQKQATLDFAAGRTEEGLKAYEEKGCVHIEKDAESSLRLLVNDWFKLRSETQKSLKEYSVIAHSNEDVNQLNQLIRNGRIANGEIAEGYDVTTSGGQLKIAKDDRVIFLENNDRLGVRNGRFGTVSSVDFTETGQVLKIHVTLDKGNKTVSIDPSQYKNFTHGYAATVHKNQGATYDHNFVYAGKGGLSWDRFLSYVAMSRHRLSCHLYTNQEGVYGELNLAKQMGKKRIKDSVMDYPLSFAERRGIDTSVLIKLLPQKLTNRLKSLKKDVTDRYTKLINPEAYQQKKDQTEKLHQQKVMAEEKAQRNEDARIIADYVDANRQVGIFYESLQTKLKGFGLEKISYVPEDFSLISETTEYKNLNLATQERNRIAASFVPNIGHYRAAIEHYGLDLLKLNQYASAHESRERVLAYHSLTDNASLKDKMAFDLMDNIKAHYPYLQEFGITTKYLRQDATNHLKQSLLETLNPAEREILHSVEKYRELTTEIGKLWAEKISHFNSIDQSSKARLEKAEIVTSAENGQKDNKATEIGNPALPSEAETELLNHFNRLRKDADRLASRILETQTKYSKILNFFQIGLSSPLFHYEKAEQTPEETECLIKAAEDKSQSRWEKLEKASMRHRMREKVQSYQLLPTASLSKNEALEIKEIKLRDKIAFEIIENMKAYYPFVKEAGIKNEDIKKHATDYLKRNFLNTLSEDEQKSFYRVERYQQLALEIWQCWAEKISLGVSVQIDYSKEAKNEIIVDLPENTEDQSRILDRETFIHFNSINQECEQLASDILRDRDGHYKALNFFQMGLSAPLFHYDKTTESMIKDNETKAQKRSDQLQQRAVRYERNARVAAYKKALYINDTPARLKLAHEIVQEQKAHYGAILNINANTEAFRKSLWRDAKVYERQNFYASLTEEEKTSFKFAEEYVKNKSAYGSVWREIFETEKTLTLDKKEVYEKLGAYSKPYQVKRNELAEKVLQNFPDKKILDHFKIDPTALYRQFNEKRASEYVDQYLSEANVLKRGEIAQEIVSDPKLYAKFIFEKGTSWKHIYRDSKCFTRKKLFKYLTPEEKQFLRLVSRYKSLQQHSGKAWSIVFKEKENQKNRVQDKKDRFRQSPQSIKANSIGARRDALAAQILSTKQILEFYSSWNPSDLIIESEGKPLDFDKLQKQSTKHQERLIVLAQFKEAFETLQQCFGQNKKQVSEINLDEAAWLLLQTDVKETLKPIKANFGIYASALKQIQVSQKTIEKLEAAMEIISISVKALSNVNKNTSEKNLLDPDQQKKILNAQRIAKGTRPIKGTLAERYLREHRGIQGELPESFRYHPAHYNHLAGKTLPALVVLARNSENRIQAVQIISLDPETANKACDKQSKISYGTLSHAGVLASIGNSDKPVLIAEGPETALSVAEAMPGHTVYAALGSSNFAHMPLDSEVKSVIFAADNDGKDAASVKQLERAANTLSLQGIDVSQVMPEGLKQDFNDVLKEKGTSEIQALFKSPKMLEAAVDKEKFSQNIMEAVRHITDTKIDANDILSQAALVQSYQSKSLSKANTTDSFEQSNISESYLSNNPAIGDDMPSLDDVNVLHEVSDEYFQNINPEEYVPEYSEKMSAMQMAEEFETEYNQTLNTPQIQEEKTIENPDELTQSQAPSKDIRESKQESIETQLEITPASEITNNTHVFDHKESPKPKIEVTYNIEKDSSIKSLDIEKNIEKIHEAIGQDTVPKVDPDHKDYWKQLSRESLPIKETFAERYFENSGLEVKNYHSIRFHPQAWHKESKSYLPALVAKSIKIDGDNVSEKGIQIQYLDKETGNQANIENPRRYMGDASDTIAVLQAPADKIDGRWIVALDINSAITIAQSKPDRLVAMMPSFKEIDKFPISDAGVEVTLCADKDFPVPLLERVIESFHKKNFKLSLLVSGKEKSFSQLMREKGKSHVSEQVDRAKRLYSPDIVEIIDKFKEHDKKMIELKDMPSSYKSIEKRKMSEYLKQVNKDRNLVQQLAHQAPETSLRIEKFIQKIKEIVVVR